MLGVGILHEAAGGSPFMFLDLRCRPETITNKQFQLLLGAMKEVKEVHVIEYA